METSLERFGKIHVYRKRERQKLPRDHDFPAIFTSAVAVFNAKRTVFLRYIRLLVPCIKIFISSKLFRSEVSEKALLEIQ